MKMIRSISLLIGILAFSLKAICGVGISIESKISSATESKFGLGEFPQRTTPQRTSEPPKWKLFRVEKIEEEYRYKKSGSNDIKYSSFDEQFQMHSSQTDTYSELEALGAKDVEDCLPHLSTLSSSVSYSGSYSRREVWRNGASPPDQSCTFSSDSKGDQTSFDTLCRDNQNRIQGEIGAGTFVTTISSDGSTQTDVIDDQGVGADGVPWTRFHKIVYTLSNEYTSAELRDRAIAKLPAFPSVWSGATGDWVYQRTPAEKCATVSKMLWRFKLTRTKVGKKYKIRFERVTIYPNGKEERVWDSVEAKGTGGDAVTADALEEVPDVPCTKRIGNGTWSVTELPDDSGDGSSFAGGGAGEPGSGNPTDFTPGGGSGGGGGGGGCCDSCSNGDDPAGEPSDRAGASVSLGNGAYGNPLGNLSVSWDGLADLSSASVLRYRFDPSDAEVIIPGLTVSQIKTPTVLVELKNLPTGRGFQVNFYKNSQIPMTRNPDKTFVVPVGVVPYRKWSVYDPTPGARGLSSLVNVEETIGGTLSRSFTFTYSGGTWKRSDLVKLIERETTLNTILLQGGTDVRQYVKTTRAGIGASSPLLDAGRSSVVEYTKYAWGRAVTKSQVGSGTNARVTTYEYYDGLDYLPTADRGLPVMKVNNPDGSWEYYTYVAGRTSQIDTIYSSYLDQPVTKDQNLCRTTTYGYGPVNSVEDDGQTEPNTPRTITRMVLGKLVSKEYAIITPTYKKRIVTVNPAAAWNDPGNLVTTTEYEQAAGPNQGKVKAVTFPDGTRQITAVVDSISSGVSIRTTVVERGQPSTDGTSIVDGARVTTIIRASDGALVSVVSKDIKSGLTTGADTYSDWDEFGRWTKVTHLDKTTESRSFLCCGLDTTVDRDGVTTTYNYDALRRKTGTTRLGITLRNDLDSAGAVRASWRVGSDQSSQLGRESIYNNAGEVAREIASSNPVSVITRDTDSAGHQRTTTRTGDGGTIVETRYLDGRIRSQTGDGTRATRFEYGYDSTEKAEFTKTIQLDDQGADSDWQTDFVDAAGRNFLTRYGNGGADRRFFNAKGQLWKAVDPDGVTTLFDYDATGQQTVTALDLNQNNLIDYAAGDRIQRTTTTHVASAATARKTDLRRVTREVWNENSATPVVSQVVETSEDGLKSWTVNKDDSENDITTSRSVTYGPYRAEMVTLPDESLQITTYQGGRPINVTRRTKDQVRISSKDLEYDTHGRLWKEKDVRNGDTITTYTPGSDLPTTVTTPAPGVGQPAQVTRIQYNQAMRESIRVQPDGTTTTNLYWPSGMLKLNYGSRAYPVGYEYDSQQRMKSMTTWSSYASQSGAKVTRWNYSGNGRGLLSEKTDAAGKPTTYTYTPGGRLRTRVWARVIPGKSERVTTTYTYGFDNPTVAYRHGEMTGVAYNDGTAGFTYDYDRMGRRKTITRSGAGGITTTLSYKRAGLPTVESYSGGILNGITTEIGYDSLMRKQSISAKLGSVLIGAPSTNRYDSASRITSVNDGANAAGYGYVADSSLLDSTTFTSGVNQRLVTKRVFDSLNRLRSIQSSPSTGTPIRFDYQYNSANQRERVYLEDGSYWDYRYDSMGQLRSGRRYWKDGKPVAGQQFEYGFDDIGNRLSAKFGGDQNGQNLRLSSYDYGANLLNQPQKRTVPSSIDVTGVAPVAGTLTVNGVAPDHRRGEYFWRSLPVANSAAAVQQNVAVKLNGADAGSGNVFVPQTPESYTYDDDGNLTSDGRWKYTWDAENRLVEMADSSKTATSGQKLTFEYDFNSRRIGKTVTTAAGAVTKTVFVYDGWNLIAELDGTTFATKRTYAWGLDLSGSLTGAGGVGGLLWVNVAGNGTHFVSYDGNGNVVGLHSATDGSNTVRYEYGPFGEPIRASGPLAGSNPIRFSSKYTDQESGLVYYGYRFYNAVTGRWTNRDPIGEKGGKNVYSAFFNDPIKRFDPDGRLVLVDDAVIIAVVGGAVACAAAEAWVNSADGKRAVDGIVSAAKTIEEAIAEAVAEAARRCSRCMRKNKRCLPCNPPVGSIAYRVDLPPSPPHNGIPTPHSHIAVMIQRSSEAPVGPCKCDWTELTMDPLPGIHTPLVDKSNTGGGMAP